MTFLQSYGDCQTGHGTESAPGLILEAGERVRHRTKDKATYSLPVMQAQGSSRKQDWRQHYLQQKVQGRSRKLGQDSKGQDWAQAHLCRSSGQDMVPGREPKWSSCADGQKEWVGVPGETGWGH